MALTREKNEGMPSKDGRRTCMSARDRPCLKDQSLAKGSTRATEHGMKQLEAKS